MFKDQKVLVTGGNGMIGRHLVKILKAMEEDVEDLIDTHDKAAANGAGIDLYQRITLSELKNKINSLLKIKLLKEK